MEETGRANDRPTFHDFNNVTYQVGKLFLLKRSQSQDDHHKDCRPFKVLATDRETSFDFSGPGEQLEVESSKLFCLNLHCRAGPSSTGLGRDGPTPAGPGLAGPTGPCRVWPFRAGPNTMGRAKPSWIGPGRAGPSWARLGRAGPGLAGSGRVGIGQAGPGRA